MSPRAHTASQRREAAAARRARRAAVTDADVVLEAAAAFLAVRSRSVAETRQRLTRLGYPVALCQTVVERLQRTGYLDDRAFARAWLESRDRASPRGMAALRLELRRKGIDDDVIEEVLAARARAATTAAADQPTRSRHDISGDAELDAARRLLAKRAASLGRVADARRRHQRAYALLARNGFRPDVCQEAAASLAATDAEPDGEGV